tara:strand:+ start:774 stop:1283 length:510 start_codon:yes stop_codon:yes gene_type:complete
MVDDGEVNAPLREDYFLFQTIQNASWKTIKKSSSLEELKNEFAIKSSAAFNSKFRIIYYSFDDPRESWLHKVVLLVNTNYFNKAFLQNICKTTDTVTDKNKEDKDCTQTIKISTPSPKSNIKKKSHHTLILAVAFLCFFSSCSAVGSVLYFKFPLVFQQVTELIFRSFS